MNLDIMKTLKSIEQYLSKEEISADELKKAYDKTLRLRSQLISIIYDMELYIETQKPKKKSDTPVILPNNHKHIVKIVIGEPLPARKELTSAVEEHWINMIHNAIEEESKTGIPKFNKALVMIEITTPRGTNNQKVWDTSNRAINVVINNLKGIFFKDDDFEHMAFGVTADWGETGKTILRICDFNDFSNGIYPKKLQNL